MATAHVDPSSKAHHVAGAYAAPPRTAVDHAEGVAGLRPTSPQRREACVKPPRAATHATRRALVGLKRAGAGRRAACPHLGRAGMSGTGKRTRRCRETRVGRPRGSKRLPPVHRRDGPTRAASRPRGSAAGLWCAQASGAWPHGPYCAKAKPRAPPVPSSPQARAFSEGRSKSHTCKPRPPSRAQGRGAWTRRGRQQRGSPRAGVTDHANEGRVEELQHLRALLRRHLHPVPHLVHSHLPRPHTPPSRRHRDRRDQRDQRVGKLRQPRGGVAYVACDVRWAARRHALRGGGRRARARRLACSPPSCPRLRDCLHQHLAVQLLLRRARPR